MLDFVQIRTSTKVVGSKGSKEMSILIYPEFIVQPSNDLMIRGGSFYAVWDEEIGLWSKDPGTVVKIVDDEIKERRKRYSEDTNIEVRLMSDFSSKMWSQFLNYCSSLPDNFVELDSQLTFSNDDVKKDDYVSKKLNYPLKAGEISAYNELLDTLYDPIERQKLEWAIGSVIAGDSKVIQKFLVLYGAAGSGKSTVLNIIQMLFEGYYNIFEAKALTSNNNSFALEMFRNNPLVSIQHDGDLSRIEDNTKLNSIVSHEEMVVNEKRKSQYATYFRTFLFMGTNRPVKITDAKSGIVRRLIDVVPSGNKVPFERYQILMAQIKFELSGIAQHCLEVYTSMGIDAYNLYQPIEMMGATNDFYNFVGDHIDIFEKNNAITLNEAWLLYKKWAEDVGIQYKLTRRVFKEELKSYFLEYHERAKRGDQYLRGLYERFQLEKFDNYVSLNHPPILAKSEAQLELNFRESIFDKEFADEPAQLANAEGTPSYKWSNVRTHLKDLNTHDEHYVKVPENLVVIDFDIYNEDGEKDATANLKAAAQWPTTYAEFSKSGKGVHLHYIYEGDVNELAKEFAPNIEVKVFKGNAALRRKLTRCNDKPIAVLSSGLPLKKGAKDKVLDFEGLKNEKAIRTLIERNLKKEIHPGTKPSVDFIAKILEDAYSSGMHYDVSDLRPAIMAFANNSTNHALYCIKLVNSMHFHSEEASDGMDWERDTILFYDVEVFPNLFVVVWKRQGGDSPVKMINPTPSEIETLVKYRLVGFNCRRYDNHILYARLMGYDNQMLYNRSKAIISGSRNAMFREAYNLSYADIYDFSSKKQSLKKFEIDLGIHHQELGLPWDDPVPEELWEKVADYCINDVMATEATFNARHEDYMARCLLADLSGLKVNDTTRMHATKIIFGNDKHPQDQFVYTDLSTIFPGYTFEHGKSYYKGEEPGEGGYVYAEPGMYEDVIVLDVASMHPSSLIALNLFGDKYTARFKQLLDARLAIKHRDYDAASKMLDGKLKPYLNDPSQADNLAYALKIIINSIYGFTSATFDCEFKDPRNKDNIVAKRGALFMIDLKNAVIEKGYSVVHIKTDSIKIVKPDQEIIDFVIDFGKKYGYTFEVEDEYKKFCLVNDAVYIAREKDNKWTATGAQFAVPYVFKTLFSKEPLEFSDYCQSKSVSGGSSIFLDMVEDLEPGKEHNYKFVGSVGSFCPIVDGAGGGLLLRVKDDKYYAVTGTKGYKWLEAETVHNLDMVDKIDILFYDRLCNEAKKTIEQFGSFEEFIKEDDK